MILTMALPPKLATTEEAARSVNVTTRTLHRWINAGIVKPTDRTIGGHYRWDLEDLQRQVREYQRKREEERGH
jgi:excisionase family DNA binding protein